MNPKSQNSPRVRNGTDSCIEMEVNGPFTYWSTKDFRDHLSEILPENKNPHLKDIESEKNRFQGSSLEFSLGNEVFISSKKELKVLEEKKDNLVTIKPGDFALLITKEWVNIPNCCMGFISIKSKHKLSGLINISGFHVDPGFQGKLKFSVYNAGTGDVILRCGDPTFILFLTLIRPGAAPYSKESAHWGQEHIEPAEMMPLLGAGIPVHELGRRLANVETLVKIYGGVLIGIFLLLLRWAFK